MQNFLVEVNIIERRVIFFIKAGAFRIDFSDDIGIHKLFIGVVNDNLSIESLFDVKNMEHIIVASSEYVAAVTISRK